MTEPRSLPFARSEDDLSSKHFNPLESDHATETLTDNATWRQFACLPFFKNATPQHQEEMYLGEKHAEREREREERQEEQEFKLKLMELEQGNVLLDTKPSFHVHVTLLHWEERCRMDKFLESRERLLLGARVPRDVWVAHHILPNLPEKTNDVDNNMPNMKVNFYDALKKENLLQEYSINTWLQPKFLHLEQAGPPKLCRIPRIDSVNPDEIKLYLIDKGIEDATECAILADELPSIRPGLMKRNERRKVKDSLQISSYAMPIVKLQIP
ncbi:hypothetical protein CAPTEDRAFT_191586 [Capitella teleta]|uniref:Uncharacterized protein n=1 Tax=Capitella teleta TaxID=283909 RepID=R7TAI5_CAPTE|nr:hypothetical protein CAPTEDRAFT_191586 [Capitella teleta]|eukprot:ELT90507.1 hypothetical protein CAPTEDRAFT_191586 [Capitella teleta]